ncbi:MAG: 30S ribosome-binding factor RbfA [Anaerolineaceae bacterium]|nr:30S ribosome-binding factor RbfA [Anaerolineaceae bacterium]MBN2677972.1 30S ribosome-binding factor RbfA [Anaerolineaceae bacterium]
MPTKLRIQRIQDRLHQELSELILLRMSDPRLSGISITDVTVDREFAYADIYVSAVEGVSRSQEILAGLEHASGFLRRELAARVKLRTFPRLRFHWDPTPEKADHIEELLRSLHEEEPSTEKKQKQGKSDNAVG